MYILLLKKRESKRKEKMIEISLMKYILLLPYFFLYSFLFLLLHL